MNQKIEQSSVKQRLISFLDYKRIGQSQFEQKCKLSNGYVNNIRKSIKSETFDLKIAPNYPELNKIWLLMGKGEMLNTDTDITVYNNRYFPFINAAAGLDFLTNNGKNDSIPINIPNINADGFINVFGDSMYPKYCSGEIIGLKRIDKEMVFFGHAYAVQMKDGEIYLKYIQPGNDQDHWSLESENSHYKPRQFHLDLIDKVFMIKAVISKTSIT